MMIFTTLVSTLFAFAATAVASPITPQELDVFSPTITSPTAAVVWQAGTTHNVTWATSNIPADKQNSTGLILLGHIANNSENLNITHPLASGFLLNKGFVPVTIPVDTVPRDDYVVVLFGDSGNTSPEFSICE